MSLNPKYNPFANIKKMTQKEHEIITNILIQIDSLFDDLTIRTESQIHYNGVTLKNRWLIRENGLYLFFQRDYTINHLSLGVKNGNFDGEYKSKICSTYEDLLDEAVIFKELILPKYISC